MPGRPPRVRLPDFSGKLFTLPNEPQSWRQLKAGRDILLLGAGPEEAWNLPFVATALEQGRHVYCLEAPQTFVGLNHERKLAIPAHFAPNWHEVDKIGALKLAPDCSVYFYTPGLRLAPDFWSPLLAQIEVQACLSAKKESRSVWLPGHESQLMHEELRVALANLGYKSVCVEPRASASEMLQAWDNNRPQFALSVNLRGLDPNGHIFAICAELDIPLAIWLVDNPWNILSGISLPWWQEADIFITDKSFIADLKRCGAKNIHYLPLAASFPMLNFNNKFKAKDRPVFVGSSAFPNKSKFFSGLKLDPGLVVAARNLVLKGGSPDFHWWQDQIGTCLWPGKGVRAPSLGADEFSAVRRMLWVKSALPCGLRVIGDNGWQKLLSEAEIQPPIDYYGALPQIYATSECVLNVTSLLLPQSLNQRHFDVWAAGGFLLTDYSAGLDIFPESLAKPVILNDPTEFCEKLAWLRDNQNLRDELAREWRYCIRTRHTYETRIASICESLGIRAKEDITSMRDSAEQGY